MQPKIFACNIKNTNKNEKQYIKSVATTTHQL